MRRLVTERRIPCITERSTLHRPDPAPIAAQLRGPSPPRNRGYRDVMPAVLLAASHCSSNAGYRLIKLGEQVSVAIERDGARTVPHPHLDGRQLAEAARSERGQHVAVEIAAIRLLRCRRQRPGEGHEGHGPVAKRCVGTSGIDPRPAVLVDLDLLGETVCVGLASERPAALSSERVPVADSVAAAAIVDRSHRRAPSWTHLGHTVVTRRRSLAVTRGRGRSRTARTTEPLARHCARDWRRRWESNPATGLCRLFILTTSNQLKGIVECGWGAAGGSAGADEVSFLDSTRHLADE